MLHFDTAGARVNRDEQAIDSHFSQSWFRGSGKSSNRREFARHLTFRRETSCRVGKSVLEFEALLDHMQFTAAHRNIQRSLQLPITLYRRLSRHVVHFSRAYPYGGQFPQRYVKLYWFHFSLNRSSRPPRGTGDKSTDVSIACNVDVTPDGQCRCDETG